MSSSKSTEHLAFVSRQLSNLLADEKLEPALQKLSAASPAEYSRDIEYLRDLLTASTEREPSPGPNPYAAFRKLLPVVSESKNVFFQNFVEYVQQNKVVFETYWTGAIGTIWYLATLSLIALIIAIMFGTLVVPTFDDMFSQFGVPMPELTTAVFAYSGAGIPLFAVGLALLVGLIIWFVTMFHKRIQQLAPLPRWPSSAPVVGKLAEAYNLGLFLNFTRMLRESGVDPVRAVTAAAAAANQAESLRYESMASGEGGFDQPPILSELAVADRLGHLDSELAHQCDQHIGRMSVALVEARDKFSLLLKLVLYVFVGTLVVAMYLPIFKIGSVI